MRAFLLILVLVVGCSPQKRLNRKHERIEKFALRHDLVTTDTIIVIDTVIIENYSRDTLTTFVTHDSVTVINNERVSLKYFYDTLTREIYHEVECKGDTLIREIAVPVDKYQIIEKKNWIMWVGLGLIILILLFRKRLS